MGGSSRDNRGGEGLAGPAAASVGSGVPEDKEGNPASRLHLVSDYIY